MWCFTCGTAASCCTDGCSNINTPWAGALQSSARSRVLPQQKVRYTPHYVWVPHRGEQPDLIGCVLALQGTHLCNVCLLDSIHLAIGVPLDAVGTAIGTLTKVLLDLQGSRSTCLSQVCRSTERVSRKDPQIGRAQACPLVQALSAWHILQCSVVTKPIGAETVRPTYKTHQEALEQLPLLGRGRLFCRAHSRARTRHLHRCCLLLTGFWTVISRTSSQMWPAGFEQMRKKQLRTR